MLAEFKKVIDTETLARIRGMLAQAQFVDGKLTAGPDAQKVKDNLEVQADSEVIREVTRILGVTLRNHRQFWQATRPKEMLPPLISKYESGMNYGNHLDAPIMGGKLRIRSDISITVFLNDPAEYDGGELIIEADLGSVSFKGEAGDVITYPSTLYHRVEPVTRGARFVAVSWIQSTISDHSKRRILYDMAMLSKQLREKETSPQELELAEKCHHNLVRMWTQI